MTDEAKKSKLLRSKLWRLVDAFNDQERFNAELRDTDDMSAAELLGVAIAALHDSVQRMHVIRRANSMLSAVTNSNTSPEQIEALNNIYDGPAPMTDKNKESK